MSDSAAELAAAVSASAAPASGPTGTYRLQLRAEFDFAAAAELAGYLADLGVSHVYLSPILQAAPGSTHGYDVVDHSKISDDLGGEAGFRAMAAEFHRHGLRVLVDIVPNHMAVPTPENLNRQLWSVLARGRDSDCADWFDVEWDADDGRFRLPVLGGPLDEVRDELVRDGEVLRYHDHVFPLPGDHYRLAFWREGPNYRRFFEISTLIGLRVEEPAVFDETHAVILRLLREGLLDGLRIDHPDGLADPGGYLSRLAEATGGAWTVVEKILTGAERLPADWKCAGTTGYDALGMVDGLFVDPAGERPLTEAYTEFTGGPADFAEVERAARHQLACGGLRPEIDRLHRVLCGVLPSHDPEELHTAMVELLVAMPVYRAYPGTGAEGDVDRVIGAAVELARVRLPEQLHPVLESVAGLAAGRLGCGPRPAEFAVRFQQTAAPLTAKGVEDTAFYRWSRLISRNEVGGDPAKFAVGHAEFHEFCARLARDWPRTLTALSTHDTKRQEDVRARLAVLAELPGEWTAAVRRWHRPGSPLEPDLEYLLWQTMVAAWPLTGDRLTGFVTKAMREAKTATSWTDQDSGYEDAVLDHVRALLTDGDVMEDVTGFAEQLAPYAAVNVLGQKLVQLTMPGVPDVYQGCELIGLSLVDPDCRRPVDYERRRSRLAYLDSGAAAVDLEDQKLLVTVRALRLRREFPHWFDGGYEPVAADGPAGRHVVAFRRGGAITVATRLPVALERRGGWGTTVLNLPAGRWRDRLSGRVHDGGGRVPVADVLAGLPVALLTEERPDEPADTPADALAGTLVDTGEGPE